MNVACAAHVRWCARVGVFFAACLLAACTSIPKNGTLVGADVAHWKGRLAVNVLSSPVQAFSASFDLRGNAQVGALIFFSPFGTTLAQLQWNAVGAWLQTNGAPQSYASLEELTLRTTGARLPISSLFAWLAGREVHTPGWQVDLREIIAAGRIDAKRAGAVDEPAVELRILLAP